MHLVFDGRSIHRHMGGIGRMALELARALCLGARDLRVTLLVGVDLPEDAAFPHADLVQVEAGMIAEHFEQIGLPVLLEDLAADVYFNPSFSIPALKTCRHHVAVVHDVVFEDHPEWVEPRLAAYLKRWARFSCEEADRVVTVSDHALGRIRNVYGTDERRIVRIYNGVGADCFVPPTPKDVEEARTRHGLTAPYVLYLGSLEPKKGVPELIEAFSRIAANGYEGTLALAGGKGGADFDVGRAVSGVPCASRIKSLGYVEEKDKKPLLAGCDLFVYPSLYEGFGLPPLEAMAIGVPCVVHDGTSLPEVVGEAAIKTNVRDREAFAEALLRGLSDGEFRRRAATAGPARAKGFSWETAAEKYLELFRSLGAAG